MTTAPVFSYPRRRGFAAMRPEQQRELARKGGRALALTADMSALGRAGGNASARKRKTLARAAKGER